MLLKDGVSQEEIAKIFRNEWKELDYEEEVIEESMDYIANQVRELLATGKPATDTLSTQSTLPPKKRFPDPEQFDGTRSLYKGWRMKCQAKLKMDGFMYPSEEDKNFYIFSRTTSKASSILIPWLETNSGHPTLSLWKFMDEEFGDRFEKTSALDKLQRIKKGSKESLRTYRQRFNELIVLTGITFDDELKKSWYLRGLPKEEYEKMASINPDTTFTKFSDETIRLSDFYYRTQWNNRSSHSTQAKPAATRRSATPEHDRMDWQPTPAYQGDKRKRAKWVSPEELQRRGREGLCYRCGGSSHRSAACPYAPPRRPTGAAKAKVELVPPMLEEDSEVELTEVSEKE